MIKISTISVFHFFLLCFPLFHHFHIISYYKERNIFARLLPGNKVTHCMCMFVLIYVFWTCGSQLLFVSLNRLIDTCQSIHGCCYDLYFHIDRTSELMMNDKLWCSVPLQQGTQNKSIQLSIYKLLWVGDFIHTHTHKSHTTQCMNVHCSVKVWLSIMS